MPISLPISRGKRVFLALLAFLAVSAAYLFSFPQPNLIYAGVVLAHAVAGVVTTIWILLWLVRLFRESSIVGRLGWLVLLAGGVLGAVLIKIGTARVEWNWLYLHIELCVAGLGLLLADALGRKEWLGRGVVSAAVRVVVCLGVLAGLSAGSWYLRNTWHTRSRIQNPSLPPANMNEEGDGPQGPFFPSSAQVYGGQKIPSKYFMESDSCKRCHEDTYNQWFSSVHHFSSFNNQWYRKSIEYMQDTIGTKPSKWCGGCHDPAVLYSGLMDTPIKEIVHRP